MGRSGRQRGGYGIGEGGEPCSYTMTNDVEMDSAGVAARQLSAPTCGCLAHALPFLEEPRYDLRGSCSILRSESILTSSQAKVGKVNF
jgi:hypothetical protein